MKLNSIKNIALRFDAIINDIELSFNLLRKQLDLPVFALNNPLECLSETVEHSRDLIEAPEALADLFHIV